MSSISTMTVYSTLFVALLTLFTSSMESAHAESWYRIPSRDGKASVLFPVPLESKKVRVTHDKSRVGTATTHVLEFRDEGIVFTISGTDLPGLALRLASDDGLLRRSKTKLLLRAHGKEISYSPHSGFKKARVMMLQYAGRAPRDRKPYTGQAAIFLHHKRLYIVNSTVTEGVNEATKAKNLAAQDKLLKSIRIVP